MLTAGLVMCQPQAGHLQSPVACRGSSPSLHANTPCQIISHSGMTHSGSCCG